METVRQRAEGLALACGILLAAALGQSVLRLSPESRPQIPSDDVLTLVFGDARQQLSLLLFDKVEEYFHGGVRCIACEHRMAGDTDHAQDPARERQEAPAAQTAHDPWSWLNGQVHVQEHRHLTNDTAVELLPWIWASCRTSPKNTQAFIAGSYVLSRMIGKPEDGVRLLEEGIRKNPPCPELDYSLGELLLNRLRDPARAEPWFLSALQKCAPDESADDEARALKMQILFYLGYLAKSKGDVERLRAYVRAADDVNPSHVNAKNLHALLEAMKNKE